MVWQILQIHINIILLEPSSVPFPFGASVEELTEFSGFGPGLADS